MIKHYRTITKSLILISLFGCVTSTMAQNPNFHIYLCFGQSNMQGQGTIETQDKTVSSRFKTFQAVNCSNLSRTKGQWYKAVPPTCQCYSLLSPADYFGRNMVANLPDSITVGIINVAIGGCDIRLFDKDIYQSYDSTYTDSWFTSIVAGYNGNPYQYLIDLAKDAKSDGIIKGILLHQGETNTGDTRWPSYVKKIYTEMLNDLSLSADSVPLLAGEMLSAANNCCSSMNTIIKRLPDTIATAHVISSSGCTGKDNAHFDSPGYRKLGKRYADKMLSLMGYTFAFAEAECGTVTGNHLAVYADDNASNLACLSVKTDYDSISAPPENDMDIAKLTISVSSDTTYYLYGRFNNTTADSNSFWIKTDNGTFESFKIKTTNGWEWLKIKSLNLSTGAHTLSIAFAKEGLLLDKLAVKNWQVTPLDKGEDASILCEAKTTGLMGNKDLEGYFLQQNYPNPIAGGKTHITFKIPVSTYVSLGIFNTQGNKVEELAGHIFPAGEHVIEYSLKKLPPGVYYYKLKTGTYTATQKMMVTAE